MTFHQTTDLDTGAGSLNPPELEYFRFHLNNNYCALYLHSHAKRWHTLATRRGI